MSFLDDLNKVAVDPQVIKDKEQKKMVELAIQKAKEDINIIKEQIMEKAKKGEYTIVNGKKFIEYGYDSVVKREQSVSKTYQPYAIKLFDMIDDEIPDRKLYTEVTWAHRATLKIKIKDTEQFNAYKSRMLKLAAKDNISISFKARSGIFNRNNQISHNEYYDIPCEIYGTRACFTSIRILCSVYF